MATNSLRLRSSGWWVVTRTESSKPEPKQSRRASSSGKVSQHAAPVDFFDSNTAKTGVDNAKRQGFGINSLFNPLWCYHGFRMAVLGLSVFGVIMVFSSSAVTAASAGKSPFVSSMSQGVFCVIGLATGVFCSFVPVNWYRKLGFFAVLGSGLLQALTLSSLGVGQYGNNGWIQLGPVTLQPAEFVKFALCIWLPSALSVANKRYKDKGILVYIPSGIVYIALLVLILAGKDLGTALIVVFIGLVAFLTSGFPGKWMLGMIGGLGAVVLMLVMTSRNRLDRILAAYSTCSAEDAQGICYQSTHARYAIASGGLFGVGLGNSREKWNYLPAAHNDFIFAIIGEETGFIGAAMVILVFMVLGWCLVFSAIQVRQSYSSVVLMCIATWLVGQAMVNIGVVVGVFPVFGVPMPFVSAGGSSMIMCLMISGVAISMMRQQPQVKAASQRV